MTHVNSEPKLGTGASTRLLLCPTQVSREKLNNVSYEIGCANLFFTLDIYWDSNENWNDT